MSKVSIYKEATDTKSRFEITVESALSRIKDGKQKDYIETIRKLEKPEYDKAKTKLPIVLWGGVFRERNDKGMVEHSGFVCLDFDKLISAYDKKHELSQHPYIYATWLSPRGDGVKALVRIPPEIENHRKYYKSLLQEFTDADRTCINESRACFESYDPELVLNEDSLLWDKEPVEEVVHVKTVGGVVVSDYNEIFKRLLKWQSNRSMYFEDGNRNTFIFVLSCQLCRFGVPEGDTQYLIKSEFPLSNTFDENEMSKAIASAYRKVANEFGSRKFETEQRYVETVNIKKDIELCDSEFDYADIIFGDYDGLIDVYDNGYGSAETTHFSDIDKIFKWKRGDWTLISGIGNHGKSTGILQLMLIKSIKDGVKWAMFVPENMPSKLFYSELTEMLVGCDITPSNPNRPSRDVIEDISDFLSEHFLVVHPKELSPTPQYIKSRFLGLIMNNKISGILFDPFNRLINDYASSGGRDDKYLEVFLSDMSNFVKHHNLYSIIVAHPTKLTKPEGELDYPCPTVFNVAGGAQWNNMMDNIGFFHRPFKISEPTNPLTIFRTSKIRWKKIVGQEGEVELMYDFRRRRFYLNGFNPLDENPYNFVQGKVSFDGFINKEQSGVKKTTNPYRVDSLIHDNILREVFGLATVLEKRKFKSTLKQVMLRYDYPPTKLGDYYEYYVKDGFVEENGDNIYLTIENRNNK